MLGHYNCPRTGTREMRGLWFRIFSTHGTDFHNIHHLYPAIPWFNMEKATKLAIDETQVDLAPGLCGRHAPARRCARVGSPDLLFSLEPPSPMRLLPEPSWS
jgi:fatty acid desaturase